MKPPPKTTPAPPKTTPALVEARINQEAIGAGLRRLFDEVINEPVPDDFLAILRDADDEGDSPDDKDAEARR